MAACLGEGPWLIASQVAPQQQDSRQHAPLAALWDMAVRWRPVPAARTAARAQAVTQLRPSTATTPAITPVVNTAMGTPWQ